MQATGQYVRFTQDGHMLTADEQNIIGRTAQLAGRGLQQHELAAVVKAIKEARPGQPSDEALVQALRDAQPSAMPRRQNIFF